MAMTQEYVRRLVFNLKKMGHNDANPFIGKVIISAPIPENVSARVTLQVQTKQPSVKLSDYHVWIRPLSGQVIIMTEDGPMDVDVVYGILNGSDGIPPAACIDDTNTWL